MKKQILSLFGILLLLCLGATGASGEEIKVGGGGAPIDGFFKPVKEPFEKTTGINMTFVFSNATLAFKQLMANEVDLCSAGMAYDDLVKAMEKEKMPVANPGAFSATTIGASKIATMVHKDNPVNALTLDQLKGIFTGKITNWKEVGGKDAPILIVLTKINPATVTSFRTLAMSGEPYATDVLDAGSFEDVREKVAANPEAIAFNPAPKVDQSVKTVQTPEVSRPMIVVTKGAPSPKVQKLLDFMKGEGKKYLKQ
ncbi:substrate-binding domain-containing protein [Geomonas sp. RF6]|uniref:substrate-binding domain-containing protein n=1 Tax=Geomonas sp. RF6 TaxID=2897342 RepID=UPI001E4498C5|nr:substrate-binding domain-containing protein [Geomonas sp. RF6]UFS71523.1 substrate-binding domain-containing protein [Geomonas sp. RF6]